MTTLSPDPSYCIGRRYDEKRDFIRMRINTGAVVVGEDGMPETGLCHNLSGGGALLEMEQHYPTQTAVAVSIQSEHSHSPVFEAQGHVVRCEMNRKTGNYMIGVEYASAEAS